MPRWVERDFNKNPQFNTNIARFPAQQADNRSAAEKVREALGRRNEQPEATQHEPLAERVKKKLQGPQLPEDAESATDSLSLQERVNARLAKMRSQTTPQSHSVIERFESPTGYFVYRDTERNRDEETQTFPPIVYELNPIHADYEDAQEKYFGKHRAKEVYEERKATGAWVYTSKDGHKPTKYKRLSYPKLKKDETLKNAAVTLNTASRVIERTDRQWKFTIPDDLKCDLSLLGEQKEGFSTITVSSMLMERLNAFYGFKKDKDVQGKTVTVIGPGLDPSIFNLSRIGAHVIAFDPIYRHHDLVLKKVDEFVEKARKHSRPQIGISVFDFNTGIFKPLENTEEDPYVTDTKRNTEKFLTDFQARPMNVRLMAASADSLPLKTAASDKTVSIRCISAMGAFYDFMTLSVLEGLRITQKNGSFRILPWNDYYYFEHLKLGIPAYFKHIERNKEKLETLLRVLGIKVEKEFIPFTFNDGHVATALTLKHTDESFRRFQDYPRLLEQLSK